MGASFLSFAENCSWAMAGLLAHRWQLVPTAHLPRLYRLVVLRAVLLCLQWRDRAGFAPSFPFKPPQGHHRSIPLYHVDSAHSYAVEVFRWFLSRCALKPYSCSHLEKTPGVLPMSIGNETAAARNRAQQRRPRFRRNPIEIRQQLAHPSDGNFPTDPLNPGWDPGGRNGVDGARRALPGPICGDP